MGSSKKVVTADKCNRRKKKRICVFRQPHRLDRCARTVVKFSFSTKDYHA